MKKNKHLLILFFIFILFNTCETDFDINADWKDITVVYGLLNQNDSVHYVKITKAFLGESNALVMAQNPDYSNYGTSLEVRVEEWENQVYNRTFSLDTTTITNKEPGTFYYPNQIVYKFNGNLNEDCEYKLTIKNTLTNKIITSNTNLVHNFSIEQPYYNPANPVIGFTGTLPKPIKWNSAPNGRRYQLLIRFHYTETNTNTSNSTELYVDWLIGTEKSSKLDGGEEMSTEIINKGFFETLHNKIPVNYDVTRIAGMVDFIFTVAGDDLNTYMEVNEPSNSIVQERPEYTNINNGIGIFSCRYEVIRSFYLNANSREELRNGEYTCNLMFD
jgi:hypothetical protein